MPLFITSLFSLLLSLSTSEHTAAHFVHVRPIEVSELIQENAEADVLSIFVPKYHEGEKGGKPYVKAFLVNNTADSINYVLINGINFPGLSLEHKINGIWQAEQRAIERGGCLVSTPYLPPYSYARIHVFNKVEIEGETAFRLVFHNLEGALIYSKEITYD
ncbi:MAG: hypothetical protein AB8F95_13080 [Bacteroidia bacterium]